MPARSSSASLGLSNLGWASRLGPEIRQDAAPLIRRIDAVLEGQLLALNIRAAGGVQVAPVGLHVIDFLCSIARRAAEVEANKSRQLLLIGPDIASWISSCSTVLIGAMRSNSLSGSWLKSKALGSGCVSSAPVNDSRSPPPNRPDSPALLERWDQSTIYLLILPFGGVDYKPGTVRLI